MRLSEMLSTKNKLFHILVALLAEPAYGFDMSGRKNCDRLTSGCWSTRKEGVRQGGSRACIQSIRCHHYEYVPCCPSCRDSVTKLLTSSLFHQIAREFTSKLRFFKSDMLQKEKPTSLAPFVELVQLYILKTQKEANESSVHVKIVNQSTQN